MWTITFLSACSTSVPELRASPPTVLVIHPGGYRPVELTREELQQGMPKGGKPRFILTSADLAELVKAAGYLEWCRRITGKRFDCRDDLNASGGLDGAG